MGSKVRKIRVMGRGKLGRPVSREPRKLKSQRESGRTDSWGELGIGVMGRVESPED